MCAAEKPGGTWRERGARSQPESGAVMPHNVLMTQTTVLPSVAASSKCSKLVGPMFGDSPAMINSKATTMPAGCQSEIDRQAKVPAQHLGLSNSTVLVCLGNDDELVHMALAPSPAQDACVRTCGYPPLTWTEKKGQGSADHYGGPYMTAYVTFWPAPNAMLHYHGCKLSALFERS